MKIKNERYRKNENQKQRGSEILKNGGFQKGAGFPKGAGFQKGGGVSYAFPWNLPQNHQKSEMKMYRPSWLVERAWLTNQKAGKICLQPAPKGFVTRPLIGWNFPPSPYRACNTTSDWLKFSCQEPKGFVSPSLIGWFVQDFSTGYRGFPYWV